MNEQGRGERGSIEPRRGRQGLSNIFDYEPFRGFFPGNWHQLYGIDVNRHDDAYEIEMAVPGFRPEDIEITYQDGVITVNGRNERRTFTRSLTVPEDIDEEQIEANVEHGILTLTLRQHPKRQPRKISVGTRGQAQAGQTARAQTMTGETTPSSTTQTPR
jgi:HSP20 family molecular chaperone IbpA